MSIYLPDHNIVFIHIPKSGGTSVIEWLTDNFQYEKIGPKHGTIYTFEKNFGSIIPHFTIVRNPYTRILSWYYYQEKMLEYRRSKNKPRVDDHLIENLLSQGINQSFKTAPNAMFDNNILRPQVNFFNNSVTNICRQENLKNDFKHIQERLNCYVVLPTVNRSRNSNQLQELDKYTIKKINQIYEKDFNELGYSKK